MAESIAPKSASARSERRDLSDSEIEALLSGDASAFEKLVVNESERLFRVIMRIVNDEEEARNLLQETFLQAYQRRADFRRESRLTTWLYAIGINLARASFRRRRRTRALSDEDMERLQPEFAQGFFSSSTDRWNPERVAEAADRRAIVHDAINRLPDDYRAIVTLRDIEEYSTDEVARMLQVSSGAVRVRLHRARQALRTLLDPHFQS